MHPPRELTWPPGDDEALTGAHMPLTPCVPWEGPGGHIGAGNYLLITQCNTASHCLILVFVGLRSHCEIVSQHDPMESSHHHHHSDRFIIQKNFYFIKADVLTLGIVSCVTMCGCVIKSKPNPTVISRLVQLSGGYIIPSPPCCKLSNPAMKIFLAIIQPSGELLVVMFSCF